MLLKGFYRVGKHNPKAYKSSVGPHYGRRPLPFNAARFARNCKRAETLGNTRWNAEMLSHSEKEPEQSNTDDIDTDPKTVEAAFHTFEWNGLEGDEDEDMPCLVISLNGSSKDSLVADTPVTMKKGIGNSSSKAIVSIESEVEDSDETDTDTTATSSTASCDTLTDTVSVSCSEETVTMEDEHGLAVERFYNCSAGETGESGAIEDRDMDPFRESHGTSTANHNVDFANQTVERYTGADHGKQPAMEAAETSSIAVPQTNPASPDTEKVETKPFNFLGCPDNVRQKVFRYLLVSDTFIKPFWNLGALEVDFETSGKENFTTILTAFAGNRQLVDEATTVLYGGNLFKLEDAKVSLWWLKRIGSNISKIKRLNITVEEGVMDQFGTRFETLWYSIFLLLEAQHDLKSLKVSFAKWTLRVDGADGLDPHEHVYVWEPRHGVVRTLLGFRGLSRVIMTPGPYVSRPFADLLQKALVMMPGQTNNSVRDFEQDLRGPTRTKYLF